MNCKLDMISTEFDFTIAWTKGKLFRRIVKKTMITNLQQWTEKQYWKWFVFAFSQRWFFVVVVDQLPEYLRIMTMTATNTKTLQKIRNWDWIQYSHSNPNVSVHASVCTNVCLRCKQTVFVLCLFACARCTFALQSNSLPCNRDAVV